MESKVIRKEGKAVNDDFIFSLSGEDEHIVKTYECTIIKKLFFGKSKGMLTVTNRRVLYYASGKSAKGNSIILKEMPIDDVSGISSSMSASINWLAMILFSLALLLFSYFFKAVLPKFFSHWLLGLVFILPYIIYLLYEKNILSTEIKNIAVDRLKPITNNINVNSISPQKGRKIVYYLLIYGIYVLSVNIFSGSASFLRLAVYILIYFLLFGIERVFSLMIFSKTSKGTGIYLSGVGNIFSLFSKDSTAADTMSGAPAKDAEQLIKELGALITDLKLMGNLAIGKW